jgi:flagellar protein FlgJ
MYDQQLSVSLSKQGRGIGLQDVLMRQLSKTKGTHPSESAAGNLTATTSLNRSPASTVSDQNSTALATKIAQRPLWATRSVAVDHAHAATTAAASASGAERNDMAMLNQRRLSLPSKLADRLLAGIVPATTAASESSVKNRIAAPGAAGGSATFAGNGDWTQDPNLSLSARAQGRTIAQPPLAPGGKAFRTADDFVATMLPLAKDAAARIGVDPTVLVAQAALETGWGKSVMRQQDGSSSHNLFGIKAQGNWQGPEARAITSEFRDGQMVKETADFRSYDSYSDSFHDLVTLLQSNNRYQGVLKSADNPEQFVKELQKAGYATDPDYASKISQIAKQMKSYQNYAVVSSSTTL